MPAKHKKGRLYFYGRDLYIGMKTADDGEAMVSRMPKAEPSRK